VPGFSRLSCSRCQSKLGLAPPKFERIAVWAKAYVLRFGKHRGAKLGELLSNSEGRSYIGWLVAEVKGEAGSAARELLKANENRPGGDSAPRRES
jgi:hypothetical protein